MEVFIEKTGKKIKLVFDGKAKALLSKLKVNPETVLIIKNNSLVTEEDIVCNKDKLKLISVISGG